MTHPFSHPLVLEPDGSCILTSSKCSVHLSPDEASLVCKLIRGEPSVIFGDEDMKRQAEIARSLKDKLHSLL